MSSIKTPTCASEVNDPTLGTSHDGAGQVPQAPVMPSAEFHISFDRECGNVTADELKGCVAIVTATSVQVMGLGEYETAYGTRGKPSGVKPIRPSTPAKSAASDRSAAKQSTGKQGKKGGYKPLSRSANRMLHGLLPKQTIGDVLRHTALVADPIRWHAVTLRGEVPNDAEDWERKYLYFTGISVEDFTCAMFGFAGARVNPMAAPDKIIGAFSPVYDEQDLAGLDKLQRLVVIGKYLYIRDIRFTAMRDLWNYCYCIPSKCFLRFTEDKVLDVSASFDVLCTLLEPSSELLVEVPEEVVLVYGPKPSRRLTAIAEKHAQEPSSPEPVLPVTLQYRAMPVVERLTHFTVQKSGGSSNATKNTGTKTTCTFKEDATILANEIGDKMLGLASGASVITKSSKDAKKELTPAQLSGYASEGLSTLSWLLKNAEKFPENIIQARTGKVLKTMLEDEPFSAFLSGCTAENSPRDEIYRVLCVIASKAWTKALKTSLAMFFRDMVLDVSAFEVYLAGVSDISVQTSQRAAMDSLRALLTDFKF
jgi:hypothetical protein